MCKIFYLIVFIRIFFHALYIYAEKENVNISVIKSDLVLTTDLINTVNKTKSFIFLNGTIGRGIWGKYQYTDYFTYSGYTSLNLYLCYKYKLWGAVASVSVLSGNINGKGWGYEDSIAQIRYSYYPESVVTNTVSFAPLFFILNNLFISGGYELHWVIIRYKSLEYKYSSPIRSGERYESTGGWGWGQFIKINYRFILNKNTFILSYTNR